MVAGRIGAAMAAEIGTMRVTEQIDALTTLSTNPFNYLVAPRLLAGIAMLPLLVVVADIIGVFGGYLVGIYKLGFNPRDLPPQHLRVPRDPGRRLRPGQGRGVRLPGRADGLLSRLQLARRRAGRRARATTNAVVSASILILIFDYILTELFFTPMSAMPEPEDRNPRPQQGASARSACWMASTSRSPWRIRWWSSAAPAPASR